MLFVLYYIPLFLCNFIFHFKVDPFMDGALVMVKGLVYFGEPQDYIVGSSMLPVGPHLLNSPVVRGQKKSDLKKKT